jgi:putative ABC transport system ATP-binding protein
LTGNARGIAPLTTRGWRFFRQRRRRDRHPTERELVCDDFLRIDCKVSSTDIPLPLVVADMVKTYRQGQTRIRALNGVSVTVQKGEFVAVMGASGSGKSTLLHATAGLTDVDSGRVLVAGQDLAALSDVQLTRFRQKHLGLVFQAFNLIPSLSAEDNIRLPASDRPEVDEQVETLLRQLGIQDRRKHKPGALSGGEQQRVAIARAMICNPAFLLADEPTGSLDSVTGQQICELLRTLCDEQRRTIVVVTHEPHVAMWADRIVVLKDGTNLCEFQTDGVHDPQAIAGRYQEVVQSAATA